MQTSHETPHETPREMKSYAGPRTEQYSGPHAGADRGLSVPRLARRERGRPSLPAVMMEDMSPPARVPPGWPPGVLPMGAAGWEASAGAWLIDQCPPDYRGHAVWRRYPQALAWVAGLHVSAELEAMREAFRRVRVELSEQVDPEVVMEARHALEAEGLRLRAVQRGVELVSAALRGEVYVPRL